MNLHNKKVQIFLTLLIFSIFIFLRIKPIILQTIPYTFDQGRDFLKVEEVVRYKNLTFIGPTTGAPGVYHGAWWYYMLAFPYIIFNGSPIGFAFFIFLMNLATTYIFFRFLKSEFNLLTALFFLGLASVSPYLIQMSFFVISSTPELPFFLILLMLTYRFFKKPSFLYQLLILLTLGFILEQEIPPGLFLIPSYFIALILTKQIKKFFYKKLYLLYSLIIFLIPSFPRIFFEIKHGFIQTKAAINYVIISKADVNPMGLINIIFERIKIFWVFYTSLFINNSKIVAVISLILFITGLIIGYNKLNSLHKIYLRFFSLILISIFLLTCLYKKEIWGTYLEGLPYFYLVLLSITFYAVNKNANKKFQLLSILIVMILFVLNLKEASVLALSKSVPETGLKTQINKIEYLFEENNYNKFCLRIYTPPVIPHTYNYLFSYYEKTKGYKTPSNELINNQCWYLIEKEQEGDLFQLRITKWRNEQIPIKTKIIKTKKFDDGTIVELWSK